MAKYGVQFSIWLLVATVHPEAVVSTSATSSTLAFVAPTMSSQISLALSAKQEQTAITYEVCLSPGCLADGAQATLNQLMSLAPPGVEVKPGVCCSLCGNGPVVLDDANGKKYKKVVARTAKVLDLVEPIHIGDDGDDSTGKLQKFKSIQQAILEGCDLISEASNAFAANDFSKASTLYETAVAKALEPAKELQRAREEFAGDSNGEASTASGLAFLVEAYQGQAKAQSRLGSGEIAIAAARAACDLSQCTSLEPLEVLQELCEAHKDGEGELWALRTYFNLPEPEKPTTMMSNKRRSLGFRLAKLEREIG